MAIYGSPRKLVQSIYTPKDNLCVCVNTYIIHTCMYVCLYIFPLSDNPPLNSLKTLTASPTIYLNSDAIHLELVSDSKVKG